MKRKELKKIKSNTLDRGMSLLNLTISSGSKFLGHRLANMLGDDASKEERIHEFLMHQAKIVAKELGKLKGSIMKAGQMLSVYGEHFFPHEDPSRFG